VDIFELGIELHGAVLDVVSQVLEASDNLVELALGDYSRVLERVRMRYAARDIVLPEPAVETNRTREVEEYFIWLL